MAFFHSKNWEKIKEQIHEENYDLRGRKLVYKDGKRVLHKPTKQINECFEVTNISWTFTGINKMQQENYFATASGHREREFKKEHKKEFSFI